MTVCLRGRDELEEKVIENFIYLIKLINSSVEGFDDIPKRVSKIFSISNVIVLALCGGVIRKINMILHDPSRTLSLSLIMV